MNAIFLLFQKKQEFLFRNLGLLALLFCINSVSAQIITPTITSVTASPDVICWQGSTTLSVEGDLGDADHWAWYQYSCGGTPIGTGQTLTITPYPGTYTYYVRGEGGNVPAGGTCGSVGVTINEWPTADITGGDMFACVSTTLTAATNASSPGFAWYKDDALIEGQSGQSLLVTQPGSYKVKVTNTATGCERTSYAFTVNSVSSMPDNRDVFADKLKVCSGSGTNIGITNSQSGVYYRLRNDATNAFVGDALSGINGVNIYLPTGPITSTTTFNVLAIKGNCTLEMANKLTVEVGATLPTITSVTASPDVICWQGSTTLSVEGDLGDADHWAWYQYSCGGTPIGTGASVTITPYPGTYTYYVRGEGGCLTVPGACSSVRVTTNEWPTASITGGEQNACVSTTLTAATNISTAAYTWYKDDALIEGQSGQSLTVSQTGSYKVKVTNTATGCERTSYAFTVNSISSMPDNKLIFTDKTSVCPGTVVNIGISNSQSGVYYRLRNDETNAFISDPLLGINGVNIYLSAGPITTTTTFNVLAIKGSCTLEMANKITVEVGATLPTITSVTASPDVICWQGSTTLSVTGSLGSADHWAWYQYSCGGTPIGTGASVTITPYPGTYTYYVRGEGGCLSAPGACSSTTVTINEWPTASITGGEQNACVSTTLTAATNISTAGYSWYKDDVLLDGQTGQTLLVTQTGSYKVKVTNTSTGCERTSSAFPVLSVSSMPENRNVFADETSVCSGSRVNIGISNSQSGVYYRLRNDNGDVNIGNIVSGINGVTIYLTAENLTETTTFNVLAIKGYCTLEMENKPTVTVATTEPSITSVTAESSSICLGASTTLTVTGDLGSANSWKWYRGSCGGTLTGTGTSIVVSPTENTTYYVRAEGGCLSAPGDCSSTTVTVNESPTASITGGEQDACVSTTLTAATNITTANYAWYKDDTLIEGQSGQSLLVTQAGNYKVKVTNTATGCGTTSSAFTVNSVSTMPVNTSVIADKTSVCPGTGVNIGISNSQSGVYYQLRNDNGDVTIGDPVLGNKGATIYLPTGALTTTTTFNVLATNGNCTLEMTNKPTVQVGTDIYEPNNAIGSAFKLDIGEEISANIQNSKDQDWFKFTTVEAGFYIINFSPNGGNELVDLCNSKGQKLRSGTKTGMTYDLLANSTYFIKIYDSKVKTTSPCYSLNVGYSTLMPAGYLEANAGLKVGELQPVTEEFINIWPNPTRNEFELYNGNEAMVEVQVLDAIGRTIEIVKNVGSTETIAFGSNYKPGIYFVKIIENGATQIFKLIKQ